MAKRLSVSATYYLHGNIVDVPVSVVDEGPPEEHGIDEVSSGTVQLLFNDQVIASQDFSKFNGSNTGHSYVSFLNPKQTVGLSVNVSVTLVDTTTLDANGIPVQTNRAVPAEEAPQNPNANPVAGDIL